MKVLTEDKIKDEIENAIEIITAEVNDIKLQKWDKVERKKEKEERIHMVAARGKQGREERKQLHGIVKELEMGILGVKNYYDNLNIEVVKRINRC